MSGKATDIILAGALASTSDEGLGAGFGVGGSRFSLWRRLSCGGDGCLIKEKRCGEHEHHDNACRDHAVF